MTYFTQRIRLNLGAVPVAQRPDSRLMGEWLFHPVKHSSIFGNLRGTFRISESLVPDPREGILISCGARFKTCLCRIVKTQTYVPCSVISHPQPRIRQELRRRPMQSVLLLLRSLQPSLLLLIPRVWLLRQRRRKPRLLGSLLRSFRRMLSRRRNRRPSPSQMRKRPGFLASFIVCPMAACMGAIASIVMKTRRVVAFQRVPKGRNLLPNKGGPLARLWSP